MVLYLYSLCWLHFLLNCNENLDIDGKDVIDLIDKAKNRIDTES